MSFSRYVRENVNGSDIFCCLRIESEKRVEIMAASVRALSVFFFFRKLVFQSVHHTHEGGYISEWKPNETRRSQFVFIGKNIDRDMLTNLLNRCVAKDDDSYYQAQTSSEPIKA